MHTPSSAKELLYSLPVEVQLAGFRSNTMDLGQAGWDLSMRQDLDPRMYRPQLQLAIRHEKAGLYGLSDAVDIEHGSIMSAATDMEKWIKFLKGVYFNICHLAPNILFKVVPVQSRLARFSDSFTAIDPFPQHRSSEESIRDFKFFKVANPTLKDIIVHPSQVPELLDMVLKAQKPTIDDVRARERSRDNAEWARNGMKPAHQIQAQIITLADYG